jgi:hypothetical protein
MNEKPPTGESTSPSVASLSLEEAIFCGSTVRRVEDGSLGFADNSMLSAFFKFSK